MELSIIIPEIEFIKEIKKNKREVFFLTEENGKTFLKKDLLLEDYEKIIRRILKIMLKKNNFILKRFLKSTKGISCKIQSVELTQEDFLKTELRDFIRYIDENACVSLDLMFFLKKCEEELGGKITIKDAFSKYHYLIPKAKKSTREEILEIFEKHMRMDECQLTLIDSVLQE